MGHIKTTYLLGLLLALTLGIITILTFKNRALKQNIEQERAMHKGIAKETVLGEQLMGIDSLLVDGDYQEALYAYRKHEMHPGESNAQIELRIALAEKMDAMRQQLVTTALENAAQSMDTTNQAPLVASIREIQQYDSLSFALEKAKVQLSRMKRLVKQKSFGEYLTFTSSKGSQVHYVGQVKNGKAQGNGVAILSTGSRYEGEWIDNHKQGHGTFYWADGQYYEGEYVDDKRHGMGTYHWSNGEKFVGLWKDDQRTGEGTFYGKDGKIVTSGIWEDDKLIAANKP